MGCWFWRFLRQGKIGRVFNVLMYQRIILANKNKAFFASGSNPILGIKNQALYKPEKHGSLGNTAFELLSGRKLFLIRWLQSIR